MINNNFFEIIHIKPSKLSMDTAHYHNYIEIHFLITGERVYYIDNSSYIIEKGDIIISPQHKSHKFETIAKYEQYIIKLFPNQFTGFFIENFKFLMTSNVIRISEDHQRAVFSLVKRIYTTFSTVNEKRLERTYVDFFGLIYIIYRYGEVKFPSTTLNSVLESPNTNVLATKILQYVNEHYLENFSMETLEKEFFSSKVWISKIFKKAVGVTVFQYKQSLQINFAKELTHTHTPIESIYRECGFASKEYFNKVFKKTVGSSLKQYKHAAIRK